MDTPAKEVTLSELFFPFLLVGVYFKEKEILLRSKFRMSEKLLSFKKLAEKSTKYIVPFKNVPPKSIPLKPANLNSVMNYCCTV